jgi:hypothetical protein
MHSTMLSSKTATYFIHMGAVRTLGVFLVSWPFFIGLESLQTIEKRAPELAHEPGLLVLLTSTTTLPVALALAAILGSLLTIDGVHEEGTDLILAASGRSPHAWLAPALAVPTLFSLAALGYAADQQGTAIDAVKSLSWLTGESALEALSDSRSLSAKREGLVIEGEFVEEISALSRVRMWHPESGLVLAAREAAVFSNEEQDHWDLNVRSGVIGGLSGLSGTMSFDALQASLNPKTLMSRLRRTSADHHARSIRRKLLGLVPCAHMLGILLLYRRAQLRTGGRAIILGIAQLMLVAISQARWGSDPHQAAAQVMAVCALALWMPNRLHG